MSVGFAPRVNYYKKGVVSREALLANKAAYYRRWPQRRYELIKDSIQAAPGRGDTIDITFRYGDVDRDPASLSNPSQGLGTRALRGSPV